MSVVGGKIAGRLVVAVYALTIFVCAALLFTVQPMFAKMALPLLGGAPAVWNTAMVFYQGALLLGYAYAHYSVRWLGPFRQARAHLAVLLLPLVVLPIGLSRTPPSEAESPVAWLLVAMAVSVGLPFVVLSASSPLLQRWLSATDHPSRSDPYFLYAASNAGSMLGLLAYPVLVEPRLSLGAQAWLWSWGYGLAAVGLAWAAMIVRRQGPPVDAAPLPIEPIAWRRKLRWVALAFVPSSLMLGATTYLTTDLAAAPLLWVIPLSLYLLTFVLAFSRRLWVPRGVTAWLGPPLAAAMIVTLVARIEQPLAMVAGIHVLAFFVMALALHRELADDRPRAEHLTGFFLLMSLGGVLGGAFNALVAPVLFDAVHEYPLAMAFGLLLLPRLSRREGRLPAALDGLWPVLVGGALVAGFWWSRTRGLVDVQEDLARFGLAAGLCLIAFRRPVRLTLGLLTFFGGSLVLLGREQTTIFQERGFYGVLRVRQDRGSFFRILYHGSTIHGMQNVEEGWELEPLSYYSRTSPIGQTFLGLGGGRLRRVGVVGLGVGSLAAYSLPHQDWTFYEIDPGVARLASDPSYFTFLSNARARTRIVLGDARLSLARPGPTYDLLVLDAYSSDSVPVHLLTVEALDMYLARLAPGGVIAVHLSNRHFAFEPLIAALATSRGLAALHQEDSRLTFDQRLRGYSASEWALLARSRNDFGRLDDGLLWQAPRGRAGVRAWTDDFSSILSVLDWR
jgi:hypothetical protein